MNIQKEREAFEKEMLDSGYVAGNISAFWDEKNQNYDIAITELRMAWHAWKSAKAQAVPEGFVLVEIKDLREIISNAGDAMMDEQTSSVYDKTGEPSTWFDHYTVAEKRMLKAIEAQEPAND